MDNPYASPTPGRRPFPPLPSPPGVVFWYRLYAGVMTVLYAAVMVAGIAALVFREEIADEETPVEMLLIYGAVFVVMGLVFFAVYGLGVFAPPASWSWIYGIVLIALGMTSCCCIPFSVPLLIFWFKPETQAYFGRGPSGA